MVMGPEEPVMMRAATQTAWPPLTSWTSEEAISSLNWSGDREFISEMVAGRSMRFSRPPKAVARTSTQSALAFRLIGVPIRGLSQFRRPARSMSRWATRWSESQGSTRRKPFMSIASEVWTSLTRST